MTLKSFLVKGVIPVTLILVVGFLGMKKMEASRQAPQRHKKVDLGVLVEVMEITMADQQVVVYGTGTVQPVQEVMVTPQINGQVIKLNPTFKPGGFFAKDEILFEIDPVDYELALEQAKASLAKVESALASVEGRARIARLDWERMADIGDQQPNSLVLYEPQLKEAQANRGAALAALKQAELNFERTRVRAPFNCMVRNEQIDLGQYVRVGNSVGNLIGTEKAEVIVPVPLDEVKWLDIPRSDKRPGSPAKVHLDMAGERLTWQGRIVRSLGEVDPKGRMVRVVIEVADPYGLSASGSRSKQPLAIGSFVSTEIEGSVLKDTAVIPRKAIRDNSTVWIVDQAKTLHLRKVVVARLEKEQAMIAQGLSSGDKVILTNLSGVAEGMKLRLHGEGAQR
ncbi:MAG: efflux RND transporter periplasmic adaptor subunit [Proteobacteria bacterium]|nr:efflux RND transporter periplasmic adaptor subunit [Pseudomonadota bacterium]